MNGDDWRDRAACAGEWELMTGPNVDDDGDLALGLLDTAGLGLALCEADQRREAAARAVCARCPVLDDCREWVAGTSDDPVTVTGIVAGLDERERRLRWGHPTEADWRSIDRLERLPYVLDGTREGKTVERLAIELAVDPRTVKRARAALKGAGLLAVTLPREADDVPTATACAAS